MRRFRFIVATLVTVFFTLAGSAMGAIVDTVDWADDATLDGTGIGTLAGGTLTVTYTTVPAAGNAGITIADNWDVSLATDGAVDSGASNLEGGVLGTLTGSFVQTVSFSDTVIGPIFYANFSDATTTMDFGALSLTLLDSNNASLAGSLVTFAGSANGFHDGFAARIDGVFGPGAPISFEYFSAGSVTNFDSVGFTIGLDAASAVPEPSTLTLFGMMTVLSAAYQFRRRRSNV